MWQALIIILSSYRHKGSKLSVNSGAAGSPPELPRPAHDCSQHSPVCPVHEHKGQPGHVTAALQVSSSIRSSWAPAPSSSAYTRQASSTAVLRRSAPHTPDAQTSLTPTHICAIGHRRRRGCSCHADSHDYASGSASPGPAGPEAGTLWQWRGSWERESCSSSSSCAPPTSRGETASRAQPGISR